MWEEDIGGCKYQQDNTIRVHFRGFLLQMFYVNGYLSELKKKPFWNKTLSE